ICFPNGTNVEQAIRVIIRYIEADARGVFSTRHRSPAAGVALQEVGAQPAPQPARVGIGPNTQLCRVPTKLRRGSSRNCRGSPATGELSPSPSEVAHWRSGGAS